MAADYDPKDLTVDIFFGSMSSGGSSLLTAAQNALLEAFKAAGKLEDLATRLAIPIQLLTVTGAKVVAEHGYDAYKITIAIRSNDPNTVAKEIFSTGIGTLSGSVVAPIVTLAFAPLLSPLGSRLAGGGLGLASGWLAGEYAKDVWDDTISHTGAGQWSLNQLSSTFGIGLQIKPGIISLPNAGVPSASQAPNSILLLDPVDRQVKPVFSSKPYRNYDVDVPNSPATYVVQDGDSLWKIAATNGWDFEALKAANPQITDPNFIHLGQKINGLTPVQANNTVDIRTYSAAPTTSNAPSDPSTSSASNGIGATSGNYTASMNVSVLNEGSAYWQGVQSSSLTGGYRPGNTNLSNTSSLISAVTQAADSFANFQSIDQIIRGAASLTTAGANTPLIPADPLVLDLNGDGVKLVNYSDSAAYFDIDNDGGSREHTGWASTEDGILVHDLNSNGVIDGIKEMLSEYYNGVAGSNGNAGIKQFTDGFAALKSLDTNHDNVFNFQDTSWADLRVWVDDNGDGKSFKDINNNGIKDAGETSELKPLAELGITQINLSNSPQSGLVNSGNEVLATGSFVQSGVTKSAQAVSFIANPNGATFSTTVNGSLITTQGNNGSADIKSYTSTNVSSVINETLSADTLGAANLYAGAGNDTLNGNAQANWLAGGSGSDTFNAGAGDDILLVDASDLQANIHAGAGNDVIQVVGVDGVTLNLAQAEAEVAVGGKGDDLLVGGGRSTVFIRGGAGDDTVIGGAANDVLSGEDGSDFIDGGAGNDLIRGQRGQDQLFGGQGDDVLDGGLDDDQIFSGAGDDVLVGSRGDDLLNGGEGIDVAEFTGNYADYRITKLSDINNNIIYRVVDAKAGRDGADMLVNIEKLSFGDVSGIDISLDNPIPVEDVITIADRQGVKLIKIADLLANDRDWQGDALHITAISDIKGGTIVGSYNPATRDLVPTLTLNGELQFIPDPANTGVMGFKYKLADSDGTVGATASIKGTDAAAEMRGEVFIKTPDMPTDSLFTDQWYLNDINVLPVWKDAYGQGYTGKNVKIAQFEPGMPFSTGPEVFDYNHPDLQANVDANWLANASDIPRVFSQHATLVAGVMVAARNGDGAVGIAYDAELSGHYIQGSGLEVAAMNQEITGALAQFKYYDVVNNSWGSAENFEINVVPVGLLERGILDAVKLGRNGLGTAIVMAGGNDRQNGGNTNTNALSANRAVITTGAINAVADISTLTIGQAPFSNPGASILISAPGSNVTSTSRTFVGDDGTIFGSDSQITQGTSFATPIVSGVVALMLEANSALGWRDIQQILAITARKVDDPNTDTVWNAADNWNGGGMHTSHDYGFGDVDARAAVRLAETWQGSHTIQNERHLGRGEGSMNDAGPLNLSINDGAVITRTLNLGGGLRVEHASVSLDITHSNWGDLTVELISPTGTISKLISNPGTSTTNPGGDVGKGQLTFALDTTHDYGENAQGNWQLRITDRSGRGTGTLNGWKVDVYGSDLNETLNSRDAVAGEAPVISSTADDLYYYTDEFAAAPGAARTTLTDADGGIDIINASAVSTNSTINLNNGSTSTIAGRSLTINGNIEFAYGGDGNDTLTGNALSNRLQGERGNDTLSGGAGVDLLSGGAGNNALSGGSDLDFFVIRKNPGATDTITDFSPTTGGEKIILVGFDNIGDYSQILTTQEGINTRLGLGGGQSIVLQGLAPAQISEQNFGFFSDENMLEKYATYLSDTSVSIGTAAVQNMLLPNNMGDMSLFALGGDDVLGGQTENDLIDGGDGSDTIWGDYPGYSPTPGADWLEGGGGNDALYGGAGDDLLLGGSGNDNLQGEAGDDVLRGATGSDVIFGGDGNDILIGGNNDDFLNGGNGNDVIALEGDLGTVNGNVFDYYGTRVGGAGADVFKVTANGGGSTGFSLSGTQFAAYNLIADFDPNQTGEMVDLTELTWLRGFSDLSIQNLIINGATFTRVTATNGTNTLALNLRGVAAASLNSSHFKFALTPGLIPGTADNDTLTGDAGGNTLDGGAGVDTMAGRTGNDTYIVDNANDTVVEMPGDGFDTVRSSVSYSLSENIENLVLTGAGHINGSGNAVGNRITGNAGNNVLDGKGGVDTLIGGAGNDTYVVDNQAAAVVEYTNNGTDTVQSSVSYTLGNDIENLVLTGTDSLNATGNALANILKGNAASNLIDGAQGADSMAGGAGSDTYLVDDVGDLVLENADEGIDTVYSTVNHALGSNIENLILAIGATNGSGNVLDNQLVGNSAANTLVGGAGNDVLDGGGGADLLIGGTGDDLYIVDNNGDVINENVGEGNDTVQSGVTYTLADKPGLENIFLAGTAAINATGNNLANQLRGNSAANILSGGAGDDTLDGGTGADTMSGGNGDDVYAVDNAFDVITENANEGSDTVQSSVTYTLAANLEKLTLTGTSAINGTGNALDNILTGNAGANTLAGGQGNDTYYVSTGDTATENASEGTDTVISDVSWTLGVNLENLTLTGTSVINATGNTSANTLIGNSAANILDGSFGADTMSGAAGDDTYIVDNINDAVIENANEGTDLVKAGVTYALAANLENLTLTGTSAINATGNALVNVLTGNSAINVLDGGAGADTMLGSAGDDIYIVDNTSDVVTENASEGADLVKAGVTYTLAANVENLTLTGLSTINGTGNTLANVLVGNSAVNTLTAGAGNDTLTGGIGADNLNGGDGNDTYIFNVGDGQDIIVNDGSDNATATDSIQLGSGILTSGVALQRSGDDLQIKIGSTDMMTVGGYFVTTSDRKIDQIKFADNTIWTKADIASKTAAQATTGADTLIGGTGNDTLHGLDGNDTLSGNDGDDQLFGDAGNDILNGNAGNDLLDGGPGADQMAGGAGDDTYVVDVATDTVTENTGEGADTIKSGVSYTLGNNIENLTLTGSAAINGTGNAIVNTLVGNSAANILDGGTGADTMSGATGDDTYIVDNASDVVTENINEGTDLVKASVTYALGANVENLTLTGSAITNGTGNTLANILIGNSVANILDGGAGVDTMAGGAGDDIYIVDNASDVVTENANEGMDTIQSSVTYTLAANVENLTLTGSSAINGTGTTLANLLIGNSGVNTLTAGAGNDTLTGGTGVDNLNGGDGNDTYIFTVGDGQDIIVNEGSDNAIATDVIQLGSGILTSGVALQRSGDDLQIKIGSTDIMTVSGYFLTTSDRKIDQIKFADNTIWTQADIASKTAAQATAGADTLNGSAGNDILHGLDGNDTLSGNGGDDQLFGDVGNDILNGNAGNDLLDGGADTDQMAGGVGDDTYIVDVATDTVTENAGEGVDTIHSGVSYTLGNNIENLTLTGTTAINGTGNALDNIMIGNAVANTLVGGLGNDTYYVSKGDTVTEGSNAGTDMVISDVAWALGSNTENLTLTGTAAINGTGNTLINILYGNSAANTLDGGTGADVFHGGKGDDIYIVDNVADAVNENANEGIDLIKSNVTWTLGANIENLTLLGYAGNSGTGNELDNVLTADRGSNILTGAGGNDTLDGGEGADTLIGGIGNDRYIVDSSDTVVENAGEGLDIMQASYSATLVNNVEVLILTGGASSLNGTGNAMDNLITGNAGYNTLDGGIGFDIVQGAASGDTIKDTAGNNLLDGGADGDNITSGVGNDFLIGGTGNDTITTGAGADVIAFNRGDGQDNIAASVGKDNTLSLGKGIQYADLQFKKSSNDLILVTGTNEQVTFKDWYVSTNNHSIANLQMVIDGTTDYNAASANAINNKKIVNFNFDGLASQFDQARTANPAMTSWALSASMLNFFLSSSDTAAVGGDLAYQYAMNGSLSNVSMTPAQAILSSAQFGTASQNFQSIAALQDLSPRLL